MLSGVIKSKGQFNKEEIYATDYLGKSEWQGGYGTSDLESELQLNSATLFGRANQVFQPYK